MGYAPFLFTSEKELAETGKWHAMWVNPESVDLQFNQNSKEVLTKQGFEYQHWQQDLPRIVFSGSSGWLLPRYWNEEINPGETFYSAHVFPQGTGSSGFGRIEAFAKSLKEQEQKWVDAFKQIAIKPGGYESQAIAAENDARLFMVRLQKIALQEKFFHDTSRGYRRFNYKKLTIFTKNYPSGITVVGVFDKFSINEEALDTQQIPYSAEFIVQQGLPNSLTDELEMLVPQVDLDFPNTREKFKASEA